MTVTSHVMAIEIVSCGSISRQKLEQSSHRAIEALGVFPQAWCGKDRLHLSRA
jgi:hypothetical protein